MNNPDQPTNRADRIIGKIRDHPILAVFVVAGIIVTALGNVFGDVVKIRDSIEDKIAISSISLHGDSQHSHRDHNIASCFGKSIRTFVRDTPNAEVAKLEAGLPLNLLISVSNKQKTDLLLKSIIFDVSDIGQVAGGTSGPLYSKQGYVFDVKYKKGEQEYALNPQFVVAGNQVSAFNIKLHTTDHGVGLCWKLRIKIVSDSGRINSEEFAIVMNGNNVIK